MAAKKSRELLAWCVCMFGGWRCNTTVEIGVEIVLSEWITDWATLLPEVSN
jgi:hypothetical protein